MIPDVGEDFEHLARRNQVVGRKAVAIHEAHAGELNPDLLPEEVLDERGGVVVGGGAVLVDPGHGLREDVGVEVVRHQQHMAYKGGDREGLHGSREGGLLIGGMGRVVDRLRADAEALEDARGDLGAVLLRIKDGERHRPLACLVRAVLRDAAVHHILVVKGRDDLKEAVLLILLLAGEDQRVALDPDSGELRLLRDSRYAASVVREHGIEAVVVQDD